jgi:hypothetical protein
VDRRWFRGLLWQKPAEGAVDLLLAAHEIRFQFHPAADWKLAPLFGNGKRAAGEFSRAA